MGGGSFQFYRWGGRHCQSAVGFLGAGRRHISWLFSSSMQRAGNYLFLPVEMLQQIWLSPFIAAWWTKGTKRTKERVVLLTWSRGCLGMHESGVKGRVCLYYLLWIGQSGWLSKNLFKFFELIKNYSLGKSFSLSWCPTVRFLGLKWNLFERQKMQSCLPNFHHAEHKYSLSLFSLIWPPGSGRISDFILMTNVLWSWKIRQRNMCK